MNYVILAFSLIPIAYVCVDVYRWLFPVSALCQLLTDLKAKGYYFVPNYHDRLYIRCYKVFPCQLEIDGTVVAVDHTAYGFEMHSFDNFGAFVSMTYTPYGPKPQEAATNPFGDSQVIR